MMTRISDYLLSAPPSDADITGNIIPVADIEGRDAALRKEDYYYLRELWSAFRNDGVAYTSAFTGNYSLRSLIASEILSYLNQWKSDTSINEHTHMRAGLASYSFTGSIESTVFQSLQFFNWMKDNDAVVKFDGSPVSPSAGKRIEADVVRHLYRFLAQDMFRQVRDISLGVTRAFTFTTEVKDIPYSYPTLDKEDNLEFVQMVGQVKGSGGYVNTDGISSNGQQVGMHTLKRHNSSAGAYEYYNSVAFPSSTITADITFSAPVVDAYALMTIYIEGRINQGLQVLRPMTGSGVNWSVDILKRSDYDLVTSNISVPALDEWIGTSATPTYFHAKIERVFARFASPYFALPSEWDWSPS